MNRISYSLVLAIIVVFNSLYGLSQETFSIPQGEQSKELKLWDDSENIPKFELGISPLSLTFLPQFTFGYDLNGIFRYSSKIWFDTTFKGAYPRKFDVLNDAINGYTFSCISLAHYSLISKQSKKGLKTPISYDDTGLETFIGVVKVPRTTTRKLFVDLGLGYLNSPSNYKYRVDGGSLNQVFLGGDVSSLFLQGGVTYQKIRSHKTVFDNMQRSSYKYGSFYGHFILGLVNKFPVYEEITIVDGQGEFVGNSYFETETGFENLERVNFGWRTGYRKTMGIKNKGMALVFGVEIGGNPGYRGADSESGTSYFNLSFGLNFGKNPW